MDTRSQIAEKVKELQEKNNRRAEEAEQAEKMLAEGSYKSEPVVEQVRKDPATKKKRKKKKKVSVQQEDKASSEPAVATSEIKPENIPEPAAEEKQRKPLKDSMKEMESILFEKEDGKAKPVQELEPAPDTAEEPAAKEQKTNIVKPLSAKHRGPHAVGRTKIKYVDLEGRPIEEFCIIDPLTGENFPLIREVTVIGKSQTANIVIANNFVSRRHVEITRRDGGYFIKDLGSTNGTEINGKPIERGEEVPLEVGDQIVLARTKLIFDVNR